MARNAMSRMPQMYVRMASALLLATQAITRRAVHVKQTVPRTAVQMAHNAMSRMPQMHVQMVSVPLLATQAITVMAVRVKKTV